MRRIEALSGIAALLLVWLIVADWGEYATPLLLPPLHDVIIRLIELAKNGDLQINLVATLYRWVVGFALGVFAGVAAGLVVGTSQRLYRIVELPIEFFRSLPVTAIFPLFLMLFGIGDESKIAMAFLPTFLLMLVNTSYGVLHATPERRRMAYVFGATKLQVFFHVIFFEALPQVFIGLRLALSLSLIVTVVSEMFIGTEFGLGERVYDSYLTNSVSTLYALLLVLGMVGYALNKGLLMAERKLIFWAGK